MPGPRWRRGQCSSRWPSRRSPTAVCRSRGVGAYCRRSSLPAPIRLMRALALSLCFVASALSAQNPEVYLAPITVRGPVVTVGTALNVTNRAGYDNQPSFTADGRALYFTSVREDAQADIYRYNLEAKTTGRFTKSAPESEYSAAEMPHARSISVIRVEKDSTQ